MLQSYVVSSILTLSLTFSWYSFYDVRFVFRFFEQENQDRRPRFKPVHVVPLYMWDIYNNGINSSEVDIVKGIHPFHIGSSVSSRVFRNHRRKQLEFKIPEGKEREVLVKAEVRITAMAGLKRNRTTCFQIYLKSDKWIFLDEEKVSSVELTWISLRVAPAERILKPGSSVTFLILTRFPNNGEENCCGTDFFNPVLLLSYISGSDGLKREKRNLGLEDYEEETNRIWAHGPVSQVSKITKGNSCRRKPLYIKFSDIDYDSWIVAPTGYEAFQCVGKCNFPVGEHLSPTKHAILQTLLHNIYPWKVSRACCVPTRLDPISILYLDENGVLTYRFRYRDMVVAECGCR